MTEAEWHLKDYGLRLCTKYYQNGSIYLWYTNDLLSVEFDGSEQKFSVFIGSQYARAPKELLNIIYMRMNELEWEHGSQAKGMNLINGHFVCAITN